MTRFSPRCPACGDKQILEIGSGTSPLKLFYPSVVTSDVLPLDYLDHVFDCHDIDRYDGIADHSVDVISLTNVLHHLRDPLEFLTKATRKLKPGGEVIAVEPYFSALSYPLYKLLHHEPVDFGIARPRLESIEGPLSSSNQAIPHMLFVSRPDWLAELAPLLRHRQHPVGLLLQPVVHGDRRDIPLHSGSWRHLPSAVCHRPDFLRALRPGCLRHSSLPG